MRWPLFNHRSNKGPQAKVTATVMVLPQKDYTRKELIIIAGVFCQMIIS
jgi:hypothetical protein